MVILEPNTSYPDGYIELTFEQISLKDYKTSKCRKIHLGNQYGPLEVCFDCISDKIPFENEFYIVSAKDLILARERGVDDRLEWLIQKKSFDKALELVKMTDPYLTKYKYKVGSDWCSSPVLGFIYGWLRYGTFGRDRTDYNNLIDDIRVVIDHYLS